VRAIHERLASVLRTARVPMDADGLGSYPLDSGQVAEIAFSAGATLDRRDLDFFLEPYEARPQKAVG
jgi:hypothetical protein